MTQVATIQQRQQAVIAATEAKQFQHFPPLDQETRSHVETACAGFHLNRKSQTMRSWASLGNGPIRPVRINGRLAWAVAEIAVLLSGGQ